MERIRKLEEFLTKSPGDSFLQHALALEYVKLGNDDEAKKLFTDILDVNPSYIGSYYHLAKLLERIGDKEQAMIIYENGMKEAKHKGDMHAYNELQAAYEDLAF